MVGKVEFRVGRSFRETVARFTSLHTLFLCTMLPRVTMGAQTLHLERADDPCVVHSRSSRSCFCTLSLKASSLSWAISSIVGPAF